MNHTAHCIAVSSSRPPVASASAPRNRSSLTWHISRPRARFAFRERERERRAKIRRGTRQFDAVVDGRPLQQRACDATAVSIRACVRFGKLVSRSFPVSANRDASFRALHLLTRKLVSTTLDQNSNGIPYRYCSRWTLRRAALGVPLVHAKLTRVQQSLEPDINRFFELVHTHPHPHPPKRVADLLLSRARSLCDAATRSGSLPYCAYLRARSLVGASTTVPLAVGTEPTTHAGAVTILG